MARTESRLPNQLQGSHLWLECASQNQRGDPRCGVRYGADLPADAMTSVLSRRSPRPPPLARVLDPRSRPPTCILPARLANRRPGMLPATPRHNCQLNSGMRPLHPADPPLSTLTEDAIPSVQEQLLDRTRRAGLARSLAEHREPTPQAVAAAPGSHDARRGSREVGSSSVAIRHSHAECALRGPLVWSCSVSL